MGTLHLYKYCTSAALYCTELNKYFPLLYSYEYLFQHITSAQDQKLRTQNTHGTRASHTVRVLVQCSTVQYELSVECSTRTEKQGTASALHLAGRWQVVECVVAGGGDVCERETSHQPYIEHALYALHVGILLRYRKV